MEQIEEINKRYWYACQRFTELRAMERNIDGISGGGASRFRDLMLCLPEIRYVAGKMLNTDIGKLPLLFKVCPKYTKEIYIFGKFSLICRLHYTVNFKAIYS